MGGVVSHQVSNRELDDGKTQENICNRMGVVISHWFSISFVTQEYAVKAIKKEYSLMNENYMLIEYQQW